ncbi:MAG TPA: hypothetical protein VNJ51_15180 [Candidatus Dormibacteraeota bacterium]|nr:hypothetical protein [Candidatus Dormibacteraeota bacterium]
MRMLMKVSFDVKAGNKAIKDGELGKIMRSAIETLKPEAVYFGAEGGKRTGYFVFDLASPSDLPMVAEPFFVGLNAAVDITPAMTVEEVTAGMERYLKSL